MDAFDTLLTEQQPIIRQVIAFTIRRHRLNAADADEFTSLVNFKLVENDYEILRKWRGDASLKTYLAVVIQRLCLDFRTAQWGKWRPSAEAKRQGRPAELLEQLTVRDGYSFDEACQHMRTNHGLGIGDDELERLRATLPARTPRMRADERELEAMPAADVDAESAAILSEGQGKAVRFWQRLDSLKAALPAQDRLILDMQIEQGLTIAQISRALRIEQAGLYRRRQEIILALRAALLQEGFAASEIDMYLASPRAPAEEAKVPATKRKSGHGPSL